jgi:hypothetical protein
MLEKIKLCYKKLHYKKIFKEYNIFIQRDFGQKVSFDFNTFDNNKFEEQVYNELYKLYKKILITNEDFDKKIIILEANLFGSEKRNYNFIIPIFLSAFALLGTYVTILVNQTKDMIFNTNALLIVFLAIFLLIFTYISSMKKAHYRYCNLLAYYKLSLEIVKKLYKEYTVKNELNTQEQIAVSLIEQDSFIRKLFKKKKK